MPHPREGHKKSPGPCGAGPWHRPTRRSARACSNLLGCGSAGSGSSSSVSSSLGSISGGSSSVSSRCSRSCGVGSGRSCWLGGRSRSSGRSFHRSGCWSGFFLLATSGECSSSDQGGQNEGVLHFDFPIWTDRILKSHGVRLPEPMHALAQCTCLHLFGHSRRLYWYLVNTD